jgi:hypothetical protein
MFEERRITTQVALPGCGDVKSGHCASWISIDVQPVRLSARAPNTILKSELFILIFPRDLLISTPNFNSLEYIYKHLRLVEEILDLSF